MRVSLTKLSLIFLLVISGCSSSRTRTNDGESHFLSMCSDGDCEKGLSCICGICTSVCSSDEQCEELADNSRCVSQEALQSLGHCQLSDLPTQSVCDVGCQSDSDCSEVGKDFICLYGFCREPERIAFFESDSGGDAYSGDAYSVIEYSSSLDSEIPDGTTDGGSADGSLETDPEEIQQRLDLIGQYCNLLEAYPCLKSDDYNLVWQDHEVDPASRCKNSIAYDYLNRSSTQMVSCDPLLDDILNCVLQRDFACPCEETPEGCFFIDLSDSPMENMGLGSTDTRCREEKDAWKACKELAASNATDETEPQKIEITGKRAECTGLDGSGMCSIRCYAREIALETTDGKTAHIRDIIEIECTGKTGGPVECTECLLNDASLRDLSLSGSWFDIVGDTSGILLGPSFPRFYSDCQEATQAAADGFCIERSDCCISWVDADDVTRCECTDYPFRSERMYESIPELLPAGVLSCEDIATEFSGSVVERCPQYYPGILR